MPTTGQTRTIGGAQQWWWNGNWHTVPPPQASQTPSPSTDAKPSPAPAPSGPSPLPLDPNLLAQQDLIQRQLASQLAGYDAQRQTAIRQFGLDDPSDPFSRQALLQKSYDQRVRGTTNSLAAQGQLYAGAYVNQQNFNTNNYQQQHDALRKQQDSLLAQIEQRRKDAQFSAAQGGLNALQTSTANAASSALDPSTVNLPQLAPTGVPKLPTVRRTAVRRRHRRVGGRLYSTATGG